MGADRAGELIDCVYLVLHCIIIFFLEQLSINILFSVLI